ncbi:hypothetical protein ACPPVT_01515 [Angustibacter sp. McL0619]|uniref:hypothetical protein n=1 Tax=Angustibacter sp. McL0619 TaxID=3415676 RepID=UPI003CEBEE3B
MPVPPIQVATPVQTATYAEGDRPQQWAPGDFLLTRGHGPVSRMIRFGERLRIHGDDRHYAWFNHAALVVSTDGDLVEALGRGVVRSHADKYLAKDYVVVRTHAAQHDVRQVLAFADWVVEQRAKYGFLTLLSLAMTMLTGSKLTFFVDGRYICSGFVARAMERTGTLFDRDPVHITPADLAKCYGACPPPLQVVEAAEPRPDGAAELLDRLAS